MTHDARRRARLKPQHSLPVISVLRDWMHDAEPPIRTLPVAGSRLRGESGGRTLPLTRTVRDHEFSPHSFH